MALSREAHRPGRALFGGHAFDRQYLAVIEGVPEPIEPAPSISPIAEAYASRPAPTRRAGEPSCVP